MELRLRARPSGHRHASSNTVSVAELLIRCSEREHVGRPQADHGPETTISVAALLRREGRGPHAADWPLKPRGHSRPAPEHHGPPRRNARKAAAAAGALFATGAVFSSAAVDTVASPRGDFDLATGPGGVSAGSGIVDRTRGAAPARPERKITLAAVAQHVVPGPEGAAGDGSVSAAEAGLDVDLFGKQRAGQAIGVGAAKTAGTRSTPAADTAFASGPGAGEPAVLTFLLPGVRTPAVEVAGSVLVDLPVVSPVATPQVRLTEGRISAPAVSISRARGGRVEVDVADIAVVAPDVEVTEVTSRLSRVVTGVARIPGRDGAARHARSGGDKTKALSPDGLLGNARAAVLDVVVRERDTSTLRVPTPRKPDRTERADKTDRSERGNDERTGRDRVRKAAESAGSAVERLLGRK